MILILSSPSAPGKTTLTRMLLQDKALHLTLVDLRHHATRAASSEVDGDPSPVHLLSPDDLMKIRRSARWPRQQRLRHAARAVRSLGTGATRFDIDWQGARQVREALGADVVSVFILPPSMKELRARLERRAEDSAATIAQRSKTPSARSSAGGFSTMSSSTMTCRAPIGRWSRSSPPSGRGVRAWPRGSRVSSRGCWPG